MTVGEIRQLTHDSSNHILTNTNVWSHDGEWVYYDVRSGVDGAVFDGDRIARVNVSTGNVEVVYRARHGANVGVVTASPSEDKIAFIHGPENPTKDWSYGPYHRRGVLLYPSQSNVPMNLDACDIVAPFTPGALRGGSHVHVFSGDGQWVSFTYEDHVLATSNDASAQTNQRGIGVSVPSNAVRVPNSHPRNHDGSTFSVLVTRTIDKPVPGSDEINRAYEDAWVGTNGYIKADGSIQKRALAFIGDCISEDGLKLQELYLVDLPEDVTISSDGPLCGTERTRPVPPFGTVQRRLTRTAHRKYPGLGGVRHWPRSSPDGSVIACLMLDDDGVAQLWLVSPLGGEPRQLTRGKKPVASAFSFRVDGKCIACMIDDAVYEVDVITGLVTALTPPMRSLRGESCVYSPDGGRVAFVRTDQVGEQNITQIFIAQSGIQPSHSK